MLLAAVIVAFFLGAVVTLLAQYWIAQRWFSRQPQLFPPYKQQHEKVQLPQVLLKSVAGIHKHHSSKVDLDPRIVTDDKKGAKLAPDDRRGSGKSFTDEKRGSKAGVDDKTSRSIPEDKRKDLSVILNVIFQFLFAELKDTARVRRWAARKMNVEFEEMLASTSGKLMNQIQVRDFNFGSSFPLVEAVELKHVELSNDEDIIKTVDVALDVDYEGGFQLTLDVDIIFGAWAYLSISVTKLAGQGRLQLTRVPFTHWSFSFYEEPRMEFNVDSRFNGRPIPQISSLIVNQIKRTIRKKHVLPSYKMRYKPLFIKPEESFINPDICFHGHRLGAGKLSVKVLKCSRLQELSAESRLFCTLSVDKEEIEEVWRQSWTTLHMTLKIVQNSGPGLNLKDQLSGEKTEKKRVVVESIVPGSAAARAGFQRGDIVETIGDVRVLSFKHAAKQLKNATENITVRVKRQSRLALDPNHAAYIEQADELEVEEREINGDLQEDLADFVNIDYKHQRSSSLNTEIQPNQEPVKLSEKLTRKIQSGKKRILGVKDVDKESLLESKSLPPDDEYLQSVDKTAVQETVSATSFLLDKSQSAKSSPQRQMLDLSRQRAHSDTSLNKAQDGDTGSVSSDIGCYGYPVEQRRMGEVATREVSFSSEPEWNEEFEFDCKEEDQYVNVCVWCKMAQTDRQSKHISTTNKPDGQPAKGTPPNDDLPLYDVTTKIGYVSIPLADITAGCLLTVQGDTQYTMYLHPPEETITATRTKLPYSGHIGFDRNICHGDITLSFVHKPFKAVDPPMRKELVNDILNPPPVKVRAKSLEREKPEGQHSFRPCQFAHRTYCDFCGKKIWLKGGLRCNTCRMVCHKKCVEKCSVQTKCSKDGPKIADRPDEAWLPPVKAQEPEKEEGKSTGKFWRFRQKEQPSLPLNIPQKNVPSRIQVSSSPSRSPLRTPSPFANLLDHGDGGLTVAGLKKNLSNKSLPGMDRDDDSDDEFRYRQPTYSLDDNVVIEAKEKGKELYANLSLPERKKTLDDMVTKLQDTIDKESEYKSELIKTCQETPDTDHRRLVTQQIEKCDEKMEALMMMLVHYCAGLQHCLEQPGLRSCLLISCLSIKRTIRKKHVLPSYKMRYKPLFIKPEESFINPDICFHGHRLGAGKLSVKVLKCSRLQELSSESRLFCTLSVDKEEIEEVWRQSWTTLHMTLKIVQNSGPGLNLKDQLSGEKTEKKRVVVESIVPGSAAARAGFQRGDIVETIGDVRVLSFKHAAKQLKNATENITVRVKRQSRLALDPNHAAYIEQADELEVEEREINGDLQEDLADFVNIDYKHQRSSSLNTEIQPNQEPVKLSEKLTRKIQSGKKRILGVKDVDKESLLESKSLPPDDEYLQSVDKTAVQETVSATSFLLDKSQSAKSSPQRQMLDLSRQRAHSDTSLNKAQDGDSGSVSSDIGCYGYPIEQRRMGEVATREVSFSSEPEWNEEFEFDCKEEDQYVNVCVWCKMAQTDRQSKHISTTNKPDGQPAKGTPPNDDLPLYDVTTKIGYVSIPLADITAGCLLTVQGDTQYTMYLHPPEETITATRTKLPYSGHIGFDRNICHGDITLSFVHKPFKAVDPPMRKELVNDILNPPPVKVRAKSLEREKPEGQHSFRPCQFAHRTYCDFCGKKIWLKGGLRCNICRMVCHKKCVEKCSVQTKCSKDGPKIADRPDEAWLPPVKAQEPEKEEGKSTGKFWRFRQKEQPSLPLNIPQKNVPSRIQVSSSPSRSPLRTPSPFANLLDHGDGGLTVAGLKKNLSNKSLPGMDRDDDSDDEFRYRQPTYSLDDNVVIEAKEKGKELYANLSLPERKKTLDDMVTKLQDTIDKESEYKSELIKTCQETPDTDHRRLVTQQIEKCDEKMEALMMMLVHYCAGLQHCLDQEEAHKRLTSLEPVVVDDETVTEDAGIQFIVTDT